MDSETQKTETLYDFLGWLEVNKKRVAIGGGAVLLLVGLVAAVSWYKKQGEFRASEALSAIRIPISPAEAVAPDTLEKLEKLAADYSGTAAAARAELIRAGLLYAGARYADAQAAFEKFVRDHPESPWVSEAYYGVAVSLDAQNKTSDAISKYEDFARRFSTDPKIDQARLHLAMLLEAANKPAEAVKEYDKIVKATSFSPAQGEAQERLRALYAKYPHLVPSNPPPISPTPLTLPTTGAVSAVGSNALPATNRPLILQTNRPLTPPLTPPAASPATNAAKPK
jgi:tetratricopeptide (TPR) repeat protein